MDALLDFSPRARISSASLPGVHGQERVGPVAQHPEPLEFLFLPVDQPVAKARHQSRGLVLAGRFLP